MIHRLGPAHLEIVDIFGVEGRLAVRKVESARETLETSTNCINARARLYSHDNLRMLGSYTGMASSFSFRQAPSMWLEPL